MSLVANANGKRTLRSINAYYEDTYVRRGGRWLIAKRKSTFALQETRELPP